MITGPQLRAAANEAGVVGRYDSRYVARLLPHTNDDQLDADHLRAVGDGDA